MSTAPGASPPPTTSYSTLDKLLERGGLRSAPDHTILTLLDQAVAAGHPEYTLRVLEALADDDVAWLARAIISSRYLTYEDPDALHNLHPKVYASVTISTSDILDLFSQFESKEIIEVLAISMRVNYSQVSTKLDDALVTFAAVGELEPVPNHCLEHSTWMSPSAIKKALTMPNWHKMLCLHELSDQQFATLVAATPKKDRQQLAELIRCPLDFSRAPAILAELPASVKLDDGDYIDAGLAEGLIEAIIVTKNQALLAKLLSHLDYPSSLLFDHHGVSPKPEMIPLDSVPLVCAAIANSPYDDFTASDIPTVLDTSGWLPMDYRLGLLDAYPGAAAAVIQAPPNAVQARFRKHVFSRLEGAGADMQMAIHLFSTQPESTLDQMVKVLQRIET